MPFSVNILYQIVVFSCKGEMPETKHLFTIHIYYSALISTSTPPEIQQILVRKISVTCKSCFIIKS